MNQLENIGDIRFYPCCPKEAPTTGVPEQDFEQMSIFDYGVRQPEAWECYKTCRHYGEVMDHFPSGEPRCQYGHSQNINPITQEVDEHSVVHFYCKYYEFGRKLCQKSK